MPASSQLLAKLKTNLSDSSLSLLQQGSGAPVATEPTDPVSDEEKLALFEQVLEETEASALFAAIPPQALPQATEQLWQQNQPAGQPTGAAQKESAAPWSVESAIDASGGVLSTPEQERQPEISPEVESYLQQVEETQTAPVDELAKLIPEIATKPEPKSTELVRVLPVTKDAAAAGRKKSAKFSIRWLVEWSDKIVKMFKGKAIYRTPDSI